MACAHLVEKIARQVSNADWGDRTDRVIHLPQDENVQVAEITRQEEGNHLSPPVLELLVPAGPPRKNEVHIFRPVPFPCDVHARTESADALGGGAIENDPVGLGEPHEMLEFADQ
jgi:hypothetical protein